MVIAIRFGGGRDVERFTNAIAAFGRSLGFRNLVPGDGGAVDLHFGGYGRIQLEPALPDAIVTLARPWPEREENANATLAEKLLAACRLRENDPWNIRPGEKDAMALTARVPIEQFTVSVIEELVEGFSRTFDELEHAPA